MRRTLLAILGVAFVVTAASAATTITVPTDQPTVHAAVAAALPGDVVYVLNDTYTFNTTLNINKAITLKGESEIGVIFDINTGAGYGINPSVGGVVMEDFTLNVITSTGTDSGYTIHASGTPNVQNGLEIRRVTIQGSGSGTVIKRRAGLDVHGFDNVVISYVTSKDATWGNGIQITGCDNVVVDNVVTSNNAWGSLAIYVSQYLVPGPRPCTDVTIDGPSCSFGEGVVFTEDQFGAFSSNIVVTGYQYLTRNPDFRAGAAGFTHFQANLANAQAFAAVVYAGFEGATSFEDIATGDFLVLAGMSIQAAIEAADAGDTVNVGVGTFIENIDVNKHVRIVGAGSGSDPLVNTVLTQNPAGAGDTKIGVVQLSASGASALDPILLQDMHIAPDGMAGISVGRFTEGTATSVAFVELDNVKVVGNNLNPATEQERGLYVDLTSSLTNLVIADSAFDNLSYGWYFQKVVSADASTVQYVTVTNTTFNHNNLKGLYAEKLSDATFTGCTISQNGFSDLGVPSYFLPWMSGVDINLKAGTYAHLAFVDCTVTDNALGGAKEGVGLTVKGRGTGNNPSGGYTAFPAWIDDVVISGGTYTGNERGLRFGEPGKENASPTNVVVSGAVLMDNVQTYIGIDGSAYGDAVNTMMAGVVVDAGLCWWGDVDPSDQVSGEVDFSPWMGFAPGTSPMTWHVNTSIQEAIDAAAAGDDIVAAAGHYVEQLHIATDALTITGAGAGATFVDSPAGLTASFPSPGNTNYPIVFVDGAAGTSLNGMTIDGLGAGNANYRFIGLAYVNADGAVTDLAVTGIRDEPLSGNQHGVGLYVYNDDDAARTVTMTDITVDDCQKNSTVFYGAGLTMVLDNVDVTGNGPLGLGLPAQNGIQFSGGAAGTATDCDAAGYHYTEPSWTATGFLVFGPATVDLNGCTVNGSKTSIYYIDASGTLTNCAVATPTGDALYAYSAGAKGGVRAVADPFDSGPTLGGKAALVMNIVGGSYVGVDVVDSWGPTAWASGPVEFNVSGATISHWDNGLNMYEDGDVVTGAATGNDLIDNLTYGAWSNTAVAYDATGNWWGAASGPLHPVANPFGGGDGVSDNILFDPWTGMGAVTALPAASGPINCGETVTLTVGFTPDAMTPALRGFTVRVTPSAELTFGAGDIVISPTLDALGSDFPQILDNGDGSFTVDNSILGPTVGLTTAGDLFSVTVHPVSDGAGTVDLTDVVLRDLVNADIGALVTGATITVDCTDPPAVTGLTSAPGHEKVDLAWTMADASDVDHYEVWRAVWHTGDNTTSAYPEYDDVNPVEPVWPADHTAAAASAEWTLVDDAVPAAAVAYEDGYAPRGIYYYEVYAVDAANNVGPGHGPLNRATNYFLGDFDLDGEVLGAADVTALGTAYGTVDGDGLYDNEIDIGPTDDHSGLGIPETDSEVDFEDLMIFALNYNTVAKTLPEVFDTAVALSWLQLDDRTWTLELREPCDNLQGLNLRAILPAGVTATVRAGVLLDGQSALTFVSNVDRNGLDAGVAVLGHGVSISGEGTLLEVTLSAAVELRPIVEARGLDNSVLELAMATGAVDLPAAFALHQNHPNPFNPSTKIAFDMPASGKVRLAVYDLDGSLVRTLLDESMTAGRHHVVWEGRDDSGRRVASGTYFYRIESDARTFTHKMLLMK